MLLFPEYIQKKHKKIKKKIKKLIQKGGLPYESELDIKSRFAYSSSESFLMTLIDKTDEIVKIQVLPSLNYNYTLNLMGPAIKNYFPNVNSLVGNILGGKEIQEFIKNSMIIIIIILLQKNDYVSKFNTILNNNNIRVIFNTIINISPRIISHFFGNDIIMSHSTAAPPPPPPPPLPQKLKDIHDLLNMRKNFFNFFEEIIKNDQEKLKYIFNNNLYILEFKIIILLQIIFFKNFNLIDFYISFHRVLHKNNFVNTLLSKIKIFLDLDHIETLDYNQINANLKNPVLPLINSGHIYKEISTLFTVYNRKITSETRTILENLLYKKKNINVNFYSILGIELKNNENYHDILIHILSQINNKTHIIKSDNTLTNKNIFCTLNDIRSFADLKAINITPDSRNNNITNNEYINDLCSIILLYSFNNFNFMEHFICAYKNLFTNFNVYKKQYIKEIGKTDSLDMLLSQYFDTKTKQSEFGLKYIDKIKLALQNHIGAIEDNLMSDGKSMIDFMNLLQMPPKTKQITDKSIDLSLNRNIFNFDGFITYIQMLNSDWKSKKTHIDNLRKNSNIMSPELFEAINKTHRSLLNLAEEFKKLDIVLKSVTLEIKTNIEPIDNFEEEMKVNFVSSRLFVRPLGDTYEFVPKSAQIITQAIDESIKTTRQMQRDVNAVNAFVNKVATPSFSSTDLPQTLKTTQDIPDLIKTLRGQAGGNNNNYYNKLKDKWNNKINNITSKINNNNNYNKIIVGGKLNINKINKDINKINKINDDNKIKFMKKYINKIYKEIKLNNINKDLFNSSNDFKLYGGTIDILNYADAVVQLDSTYKNYNDSVVLQSNEILRYNTLWSQFQYHLMHMTLEIDYDIYYTNLSLSTIIYYKTIVEEILDKIKKQDLPQDIKLSELIHGFSFKCLYKYLESLENYLSSIDYKSQFCEFWEYKENYSIDYNLNQDPIKEYKYNIYAHGIEHQTLLVINNHKVKNWQ
jgi:hypothetical protein